MPPENSPKSGSALTEIRILGLDVGEKRIGVAVSDPLGFTAQGLEVLTRRTVEEDLRHLVAVAKKYGVTEIVVGYPRHLDGRPGELAEAIMALAHSLGQALGGIPVIPWDERLTTREAERVLIEADLSRRRRRQVVDQVAAVLILQAYLDQRRSLA
jgi:putative Holliday junction resolvase